MQARALDAFLLKANGVSADGYQTSFVWKAWLSRDGSFLKWELRRVAPSAGYEEKKRQQLSDLVRQQKSTWLALFSAAGFHASRTYGDSRHSKTIAAAHAGGGFLAEHDAEQEDEYWVSTTGLVIMLLYWERLQRGDRRRAVKELTRLFLGVALLAEDVGPALVESFDEALLPLCDATKDHRGVCSCLCGVEEALLAEATSRIDALLLHLRALAALQHCPAAQCHFRAVVAAVAGAVEARREQWGAEGYLQDPALQLRAPSGRARRKDVHVVRAVVHQERFDDGAGSANTQNQLGRQTTTRKRTQRMAQILASNHLTAGGARVVSACIDAGRVGRPALELNLNEAFDVERRTAIPLPPVVPQKTLTKPLSLPCPRTRHGGWSHLLKNSV